MTDPISFFTNPNQISHRRYEALRAIFVEKKSSAEVAKQFAYSIHTVNSFRRDFLLHFRSGELCSNDFFVEPVAGRKKAEDKDETVEEVIKLRKQNHSILDIKSIFHTKGQNISHGQIHNILKGDGFSKLPKRTIIERLQAKTQDFKAPQSGAINWTNDNGKTFHSERGIGVLAFLPFIAELKLDQWINEARYPETTIITRLQSILSFLIIKLSGHTRYHHDDLWAMDRAAGLAANLNVLPKTTTLSSYASRVTRDMNRRFLTAMMSELNQQGLCSGNINMDFTAIPHWGDDSVLENNWSGKRNKGLKSVLAALCQDSDTGIFCYSNAEMNNETEADCVLEFVDFWKEQNTKISCLIFDSKFTVYENLQKLDQDGVKFITLRRRGTKILKETAKIPEEEWQHVLVDGDSRKRKKLRVHESKVKLNKNITSVFRQIIVTGNGHEKPSYFITNDHESSLAKIIRQYGKRWNVEKGISEQIEFFHLNSLSSSIVVKVDFDLTMTVAAHNIYRFVAQKLSGFEKETSTSLSNKFFANGGQMKIEEDQIEIEFKKKRHLPVLMEALEPFTKKPIPWLGNRALNFSIAATS